ncbi:MAG: nucleotidyltransferase domain-containing protein, partial [Candidatus Edwardsbacteria bacterium]|nr:nucleotidyltransferase domain-containing protein [Candidatus Edwardsbacteria bacterium]
AGGTVDLTILSDDTDPLLFWEIFKHGRLLYQQDDGLFDRMRLRSWHQYQDIQPILRREREYVAGFVRKRQPHH